MARESVSTSFVTFSSAYGNSFDCSSDGSQQIVVVGRVDLTMVGGVMQLHRLAQQHLANAYLDAVERLTQR